MYVWRDGAVTQGTSGLEVGVWDTLWVHGLASREQNGFHLSLPAWPDTVVWWPTCTITGGDPAFACHHQRSEVTQMQEIMQDKSPGEPCPTTFKRGQRGPKELSEICEIQEKETSGKAREKRLSARGSVRKTEV